MNFIVDTQLPPLLAEWLIYKGYDARHTSNYANGIFLSDTAIIQISISENRIVVTKDSDFFDYYLLKGVPPSVLLIRLGNVSSKVLLQKLSEQFSLILENFSSGSGLIILDSNGLIAY